MKKKKWLLNEFQKKIFQRIALESYPTVHLGGRPMTVSENYPVIHIGGLSNKFNQKLVLCFQEQKSFVLKTVFSHTWFRHE